MDNLNKISLPVTILIASIVLGGFYYASEANKQASIERQQEITLQAKRDQDTADASQKAQDAYAKTLCVSEAQRTAIDEYESSSLCTGSYASSDCKNGSTYLVAQYSNAYDTCLERKGLK